MDKIRHDILHTLRGLLFLSGYADPPHHGCMGGCVK